MLLAHCSARVTEAAVRRCATRRRRSLGETLEVRPATELLERAGLPEELGTPAFRKTPGPLESTAVCEENARVCMAAIDGFPKPRHLALKEFQTSPEKRRKRSPGAKLAKDAEDIGVRTEGRVKSSQRATSTGKRGENPTSTKSPTNLEHFSKSHRGSRASQKVLSRSKAFGRVPNATGCSSPSRVGLRTTPVPRDVWEAAEQEELHDWTEQPDLADPDQLPRSPQTAPVCTGIPGSPTTLVHVQTLFTRIADVDLQRSWRVAYI